jgi:multidrug transporter EmrE-like cation transporter
MLVFIAAINSTVGNLLLKKSRSQSFDGPVFMQLFDPWFLGGLAFYGLNVVLFAKALDRLPVSIAYPVLAGTGFLMLTVFASQLLGERPSLMQYAGICCILLGIGLIARSSI